MPDFREITNAKISQRYARQYHAKAVNCIEEARYSVGAGVKQYWIECAVHFQTVGAIYARHARKIIAA